MHPAAPRPTDLQQAIRNIPDFPQPGIQFKSAPKIIKESSASKPKIPSGSPAAKLQGDKLKKPGSKAEDLIPFDTDYDILREF